MLHTNAAFLRAIAERKFLLEDTSLYRQHCNALLVEQSDLPRWSSLKSDPMGAAYPLAAVYRKGAEAGNPLCMLDYTRQLPRQINAMFHKPACQQEIIYLWAALCSNIPVFISEAGYPATVVDTKAAEEAYLKHYMPRLAQFRKEGDLSLQLLATLATKAIQRRFGERFKEIIPQREITDARVQALDQALVLLEDEKGSADAVIESLLYLAKQGPTALPVVETIQNWTQVQRLLHKETAVRRGEDVLRCLGGERFRTIAEGMAIATPVDYIWRAQRQTKERSAQAWLDYALKLDAYTVSTSYVVAALREAIALTTADSRHHFAFLCAALKLQILATTHPTMVHSVLVQWSENAKELGIVPESIKQHFPLLLAPVAPEFKQDVVDRESALETPTLPKLPAGGYHTAYPLAIAHDHSNRYKVYPLDSVLSLLREALRTAADERAHFHILQALIPLAVIDPEKVMQVLREPFGFARLKKSDNRSNFDYFVQRLLKYIDAKYWDELLQPLAETSKEWRLYCANVLLQSEQYDKAYDYFERYVEAKAEVAETIAERAQQQNRFLLQLASERAAPVEVRTKAGIRYIKEQIQDAKGDLFKLLHQLALNVATINPSEVSKFVPLYEPPKVWKYTIEQIAALLPPKRELTGLEMANLLFVGGKVVSRELDAHAAVIFGSVLAMRAYDVHTTHPDQAQRALENLAEQQKSAAAMRQLVSYHIQALTRRPDFSGHKTNITELGRIIVQADKACIQCKDKAQQDQYKEVIELAQDALRKLSKDPSPSMAVLAKLEMGRQYQLLAQQAEAKADEALRYETEAIKWFATALKHQPQCATDVVGQLLLYSGPLPKYEDVLPIDADNKVAEHKVDKAIRCDKKTQEDAKLLIQKYQFNVLKNCINNEKRDLAWKSLHHMVEESRTLSEVVIGISRHLGSSYTPKASRWTKLWAKVDNSHTGCPATAHYRRVNMCAAPRLDFLALQELFKIAHVTRKVSRMTALYEFLLSAFIDQEKPKHTKLLQELEQQLKLLSADTGIAGKHMLVYQHLLRTWQAQESREPDKLLAFLLQELERLATNPNERDIVALTRIVNHPKPTAEQIKVELRRIIDDPEEGIRAVIKIEGFPLHVHLEQKAQDLSAEEAKRPPSEAPVAPAAPLSAVAVPVPAVVAATPIAVTSVALTPVVASILGKPPVTVAKSVVVELPPATICDDQRAMVAGPPGGPAINDHKAGESTYIERVAAAAVEVAAAAMPVATAAAASVADWKQPSNASPAKVAEALAGSSAKEAESAKAQDSVKNTAMVRSFSTTMLT